MPRRSLPVAVLVLAVMLIAPAVLFHAWAEDDWKTEFADICSKTDDPSGMSKDELRKLIERCDKLKPRIEKLDESTKKVYLRRLQMCRELFVFMLDYPAPQP